MKIINTAWSIQEIGKRSNQEDSIFPPLSDGPVSNDLYILCDGMGGHDKGEVASACICKVMSDYIMSHPTEDGFFGQKQFELALSAAYDALDALDDCQGERKMGTTLTFLKFHSGGVFIAHIGDSRIYHFRPSTGEILHKTRDHSLVNDLVDLGELTPEEAKISPRKNVITRAMQPNQEHRSKADTLNIDDVRPGDYFYMCSDGMLEISEDHEILNIVTQRKKSDAQKISLLKKVTKENSDNHSAHLIHVTLVKGHSVNVVKEESQDASAHHEPEHTAKRESGKTILNLSLVLLVLVIVFFILKHLL